MQFAFPKYKPVAIAIALFLTTSMLLLACNFYISEQLDSGDQIVQQTLANTDITNITTNALLEEISTGIEETTASQVKTTSLLQLASVTVMSASFFYVIFFFAHHSKRSADQPTNRVNNRSNNTDKLPASVLNFTPEEIPETDNIDQFISVTETIVGQIKVQLGASQADIKKLHEHINRVLCSIRRTKSRAAELTRNSFLERLLRLEEDVANLVRDTATSIDDILWSDEELEDIFTQAEMDLSANPDNESFQESLSFDTQPESSPQDVISLGLQALTEGLANRYSKACELNLYDVDTSNLPDDRKRLIKELCVKLIRNAVVSSIESPQLRTAIHKDPTAEINIALSILECGTCKIQFSDDGTGVDYGRMRQESKERNLAGFKTIDSKSDEALLKTLILQKPTSEHEAVLENCMGAGIIEIMEIVQNADGEIAISSTQGFDRKIEITLPIQKEKTEAA